MQEGHWLTLQPKLTQEHGRQVVRVSRHRIAFLQEQKIVVAQLVAMLSPDRENE